MSKGIKFLGFLLFLSGFVISVFSASTINANVVSNNNINIGGSVLGIVFIVMGVFLFVLNSERTLKRVRKL